MSVPLIINSSCVAATSPSSGQATSDRFHLITSLQNFEDGSGLCTSLLPGIGAVPASIRSAQENSLISTLYFANFPLFTNEIESGTIRDPSLNFFMGLIDPVFKTEPTTSVARFHWVDGASLSFGTTSGAFPWAVNEPNNFDVEFEGCVEYRRDLAGWNDERCGLERMMLCRSSCPPAPTNFPTNSPTTKPPTAFPSVSPTTKPPTAFPSVSPTTKPPTAFPSVSPTTKSPTAFPSASPTTKSPTPFPSQSPTASPSKTPTTSPTKSPTFQPVAQNTTTLKPTQTPVQAGFGSGLIKESVTAAVLIFALLVIIAVCAVKRYRNKRTRSNRFTLDIDLPPLGQEDGPKPMGMIRLDKKKENGPPLPPREGLPTGLTPLPTKFHFVDNRVSAVQVPKIQQAQISAKPLVGLAAARNVLGLPPFFRGSIATVATVEMNPPMHPRLGETRGSVKTFITRQRSEVQGHSSPKIRLNKSSKPKVSSDDMNGKPIPRSSQPPGMELRDSARTTVLSDDTETQDDIIGPEDI